SSMAAATPRATASLTALRACGRLMVMTATPPSTSADTASGMFAPPGTARRAGTAASLSLRLEPDTAVEADDLGVHVVVLDQRPDQGGELRRRPHPLGEDDRRGQLGLELLAGGPGPIDRGVDDARADGVHPDADGGEVPRGRDGHPDDPALRRGIGQLAGLAL